MFLPVLVTSLTYDLLLFWLISSYVPLYLNSSSAIAISA